MMSRQPDKKGKFRETVAYQAILLGGSTLVATMLLSFGNLATKDQIALRLEEDLKASISQVVSAGLYDNDLLDSTITETKTDGESVLVYRAMKENVVTAVIFEVSGYGYSGEIRSIIAIAQDGTLLGVRVLSHAETPGLGDKIEVRKDNWILGFNGLSIDNPDKNGWAVRKDGGQFDQFTGATITPRAVIKSIRAGLEFYEDKKQVLLHVEAGPKQ
jgi:electron transport complex protein RnfG